MTDTRIKCAWCGIACLPTRKHRPVQHKVGGKTCVGSAQPRIVHERIRSRTPAITVVCR